MMRPGKAPWWRDRSLYIVANGFIYFIQVAVAAAGIAIMHWGLQERGGCSGRGKRIQPTRYWPETRIGSARDTVALCRMPTIAIGCCIMPIRRAILFLQDAKRCWMK